MARLIPMSATTNAAQASRETTDGLAKMRILFVDDEEMVLRMLRIAVASMREAWEASFVTSGREALDLLAKETFDMVISDMRMPGMTGAQLLNEVFRLYPGTFRVILTGFVEQEKVMETVGTAHQFLSKPFQLDSLKELLLRAASLRQRLRGQQARVLVSKTGCVPSIPEVYFKILDALQAPECPVERIGEIAATDPGLTSKILQLVNSAFFGFASQISSPSEAVILLGTGTIRSLALTCRLFSAFKVEHSNYFSVEQVWTHSLRVARLAERISRVERANNLIVDQAFTAGLLHDIGKLILANSFASAYLELVGRSVKDQRPLSEIEGEALKTTHAEVGACLLQLWGLPSSLVEAVLWHEQPASASVEGFSAVTAVHVANFLDHEANSHAGDGSPTPLDAAYLARINLGQRLDLWREHCVEG
jgi:putative nucleotidyltransferase with HDIG domain